MKERNCSGVLLYTSLCFLFIIEYAINYMPLLVRTNTLV